MEILSTFSRRHMLAGLGGMAVAGAASAQGPGSAGNFATMLTAAGSAQSAALGTASYDGWSAQVGASFKAHTGHVLKLVDVQAYDGAGSRPVGVRDTGFVARFDIVRGEALPEGRYLVAHPQEGGTFEIFLTRGGADEPLRMHADYN